MRQGSTRIAEREAARIKSEIDGGKYTHLQPALRDAIQRAITADRRAERRRIRRAIRALDDLTVGGDDLIARREALACVRPSRAGR